jgi:cytochrome P450
MLPWSAAHRDPEVFPAPDDLQVDRFPNRHSAFGLGVHRCVGSNLARASFKSLLTGILGRRADYRIDVAGSAFYPAVGINTGWSTLPATFTAGPRVDADGSLPTLAA